MEKFLEVVVNKMTSEKYSFESMEMLFRDIVSSELKPEVISGWLSDLVDEGMIELDETGEEVFFIKKLH